MTTTQPNCPIWLLDIDGTLNAAQAEPRAGYVAADTGLGPVRYRPELAQRITALHGAGLVEIRWLTTWMRGADRFAAVCGLPLGLPVLGLPWFQMARADKWWKADAARSVADANPGRLIIWTDDDLDHSYGCGELDWVVGRSMLRVSPDPEVGLTDADMDAIEQACRAANALSNAGGAA